MIRWASWILAVSLLAGPAFAGNGTLRSGDAPGSPTDSDGDGLWDEIPFPYDADGDGSDWITCTGLETPDRACPASGHRVYLDYTDDINAAQDQSNAGVRIEYAPGIYVQRTMVCLAGDAGREGRGCDTMESCGTGGVCGVAHQCLESGEAAWKAGATFCDPNGDPCSSGTCTQVAGYKRQVTFPNGDTRSTTESETMTGVSFYKSGAYFDLGPRDTDVWDNGKLDGVWIFQDHGRYLEGAGTEPNDPDTGSEGAFNQWFTIVGGAIISRDTFGDPIYTALSEFTRPAEEFSTESNQICLCDTNDSTCQVQNSAGTPTTVNDTSGLDWSTFLQAGDMLGARRVGKIANDSGSDTILVERVTNVGASGSCESGSGVLVSISTGRVAYPDDHTTVRIHKIDTRYWASKITIDGGNWVPQNPPGNPVGSGGHEVPYQKDWPLTCGAYQTHNDAIGVSVDGTDFGVECDMRGLISIGIAEDIEIKNISVPISASTFAGNAFDGQSGASHVWIHDNYIGPAVLSSGMIDSGNDILWERNHWDGCGLFDQAQGSCLRTFNRSRFHNEKVTNVGAKFCYDNSAISTSTMTACDRDGDCPGGETCNIRPTTIADFDNGPVEISHTEWSGLHFQDVGFQLGSDSVFIDNMISGVTMLDFSELIRVDEPTGGRARTGIRIEGNTVIGLSNPATTLDPIPGPAVHIAGTAGNVPSVTIANNNFFLRRDTELPAATDWQGAIVCGDEGNKNTLIDDCASNVRAHGNNIRGWMHAFAQVTNGQDSAGRQLGTAIPSGQRCNFVEDVWICERGEELSANIPTCDRTITGDRYYVTDSDDCDFADGTQVDTHPCYCNGLAWLTGPESGF